MVWSAHSAVSVVALAAGIGFSNLGCGSSDNGVVDGGGDAGADQSTHPETGATDAPISSDIAAGDAAVEGGNVADSGDAGSGETSGNATDAGGSGNVDGANDSGDATSGDSGNTSSAGDSGDGSACPPATSLHPPRQGTTATLYCPFSGGGGPAVSCTPSTQHCCEGNPSGACTSTLTACAAADVDWQCADPVSDCPASMSCCGSGAIVKSSDARCQNFASNFHGTHCAAACTGTEIVMCSSDSECPAGQTCVPFVHAGNPVGGCHGP